MEMLQRDLTLVDGETLTIGDVRITPVLIPGHTPGSMGFVFDVKDGANTHTAALFGGTMLLPSAPLPQVQQVPCDRSSTSVMSHAGSGPTWNCSITR